MSRESTTPVVFRFIPILLFSLAYLGGQSTPTGNDIFFLDLGIVIEPSTGDEEVNRLVKAPPEKVKFFMDKAPSGSVFISSTRELQETLARIGERIETLESAFEREVASLRHENEELRGMISDLLAREPVLPADAFRPAPPTDELVQEVALVPGVAETSEEPVVASVMESKPPSAEEITPPSDLGIQHVDGQKVAESLVRKLVEEKGTFNRMGYMNAVFAYQREDFAIALRHFVSLHLGTVDEVTAGNVLYWIADCFFQLGEYGEALGTLAAIKPLFSSDKQDDAMVLTGLVYRQLGNEPEAIQAFANIIDYHPDSEYLKLAQMELRKAER